MAKVIQGDLGKQVFQRLAAAIDRVTVEALEELKLCETNLHLMWPAPYYSNSVGKMDSQPVGTWQGRVLTFFQGEHILRSFKLEAEFSRALLQCLAQFSRHQLRIVFPLLRMGHLAVSSSRNSLYGRCLKYGLMTFKFLRRFL